MKLLRSLCAVVLAVAISIPALADTKISGRSSAGAISNSDILGLIQSGADRKVTVGALMDAPAGYFHSSNYADLDTAITAIGATPGVLFIHNAIAAVNNVTVPTTLGIVFTGGGVLSVPTAKTVTFNGPFTASPKGIFTLTGTGVVKFGKGSVEELYPQWWGGQAISDGSTDAYAAIQAALTAAKDLHDASNGFGASAPVKLLSGGYRTTAALKMAPATRLSGQSMEGSQIFPDNNINGIEILGADWAGGFGFRNTIENLSIRIDSNSTGYYIKIDVAYEITLTNLFLWNTAKNGVYINRGNQILLTGVDIDGNSGGNTGTGLTINNSSVVMTGGVIEFFQTGFNITKSSSYATVMFLGLYMEACTGTYGIFDNVTGATLHGVQLDNGTGVNTPVGFSFINGAHHNTIYGGNIGAATDFGFSPPLKTDATSYQNHAYNTQINFYYNGGLGTAPDAGIVMDDHPVKAAKFTSINVTTGVLAAGNITGAANVVLMSTNATPGNQQVRTAAQLTIEHGVSAASGSASASYLLRIVNTGTNPFTLTTNTNVTLTGTMTVNLNTWRDFVVTMSGGLVTIQSVGTGTYS